MKIYFDSRGGMKMQRLRIAVLDAILLGESVNIVCSSQAHAKIVFEDISSFLKEISPYVVK